MKSILSIAFGIVYLTLAMLMAFAAAWWFENSFERSFLFIVAGDMAMRAGRQSAALVLDDSAVSHA